MGETAAAGGVFIGLGLRGVRGNVAVGAVLATAAAAAIAVALAPGPVITPEEHLKTNHIELTPSFVISKNNVSFLVICVSG